mmetsp:Transcript_31320/g.43582  ORF Transcript_31320/g.43582 Transcript_31320/m.43582 type:complete len:264 (+) Transcript_31320:38-829(+)
MYMITAVFMGLCWFQLPRKEETIRDRFGLLFFVAIFWSFFMMFQAATAFPSERAVLLRERAQGAYRLSAYFVAKQVADVAQNWLNPTLFIVIAYWLSDLNPSAGTFLQYWILLMLAIELSTSLGLFVSAAEPNIRKALVYLTIGLLASMLFAGFFIRTGNIPIWIRWMQWLSYFKYMLGAHLTTVFADNIAFDCAGSDSGFNVCDASDDGAAGQISGSDVLEQSDIQNIPLAYILVMLCLTIGVRIGTYYTLYYKYKPTSPTG